MAAEAWSRLACPEALVADCTSSATTRCIEDRGLLVSMLSSASDIECGAVAKIQCQGREAFCESAARRRCEAERLGELATMLGGAPSWCEENHVAPGLPGSLASWLACEVPAKGQSKASSEALASRCVRVAEVVARVACDEPERGSCAAIVASRCASNAGVLEAIAPKAGELCAQYSTEVCKDGVAGEGCLSDRFLACMRELDAAPTGSWQVLANGQLSGQVGPGGSGGQGGFGVGARYLSDTFDIFVVGRINVDAERNAATSREPYGSFLLLPSLRGQLGLDVEVAFLPFEWRFMRQGLDVRVMFGRQEWAPRVPGIGVEGQTESVVGMVLAAGYAITLRNWAAASQISEKNKLTFTFHADLTWRQMFGDVVDREDFRRRLLGTDATTFMGIELGGLLEINGARLALAIPIVWPVTAGGWSAAVPGLTHGQFVGQLSLSAGFTFD
ncbi:MAG: hypothetical protein JNJ59_02065 [Deltaproteobacteria bacterium]|nr:hypothetical protein [Deltaproteobacteria bacterium]